MLLINATLAAMDGSPAYGLVEQAAVAIEKGLIAWAGRGDAIARTVQGGLEVIDLEGRLVTPALIDCHTHVVHGGNRAREFEMRLEGSSYEEIARSGGGIVSTVAATRTATQDELASGRLQTRRCNDCRGRVDHRDQIGLRARHRQRTEDAARCKGCRRKAAGAGQDQLSRRPCRAARIQGPP
jgi:alpha-D-ribose 1-methylphosphonate 5-triphosphate diphosphatase PhnM